MKTLLIVLLGVAVESRFVIQRPLPQFSAPAPVFKPPQSFQQFTPSASIFKPVNRDCVYQEWSEYSACRDVACCTNGLRTAAVFSLNDNLTKCYCQADLHENMSMECKNLSSFLEKALLKYKHLNDCLTDRIFGGVSCGPIEAWETCSLPSCQVHCEVSNWSAWSACSASCSPGSQSLTRQPVTQPANELCPELEDWRKCNNGAFQSGPVPVFSPFPPTLSICLRGQPLNLFSSDFDVFPCFFFSLPDDTAGNYVTACPEAVKGSQLLLAFVSNDNKERYDAIKKTCFNETPVPCQVVMLNTLKRDNILRSICRKIFNQMNCKMGGALWRVEVPMKRIMIVGYDSYMDSSAKGKAVGAAVFSLNDNLTKWYCQADLHENMSMESKNLSSFLEKALLKYKHLNDCLPDRIFIYRASVGEGMALANVYEEGAEEAGKVRLAFTVVNKKINTRFFAEAPKSYENSPPGTIVDDVVTRVERYDYFLIPQAVNQGSVTPVAYAFFQWPESDCSATCDNGFGLLLTFCFLGCCVVAKVFLSRPLRSRFAIFASHESRGVLALEVSEAEGVDSVVRRLAVRLGLPASQVSLRYAGHWLRLERTLSDYNIKKESTLRLVLSDDGLRGGMPRGQRIDWIARFKTACAPDLAPINANSTNAELDTACAAVKARLLGPEFKPNLTAVILFAEVMTSPERVHSLGRFQRKPAKEDLVDIYPCVLVSRKAGRAYPPPRVPAQPAPPAPPTAAAIANALLPQLPQLPSVEEMGQSLARYVPAQPSLTADAVANAVAAKMAPKPHPYGLTGLDREREERAYGHRMEMAQKDLFARVTNGTFPANNPANKDARNAILLQVALAGGDEWETALADVIPVMQRNRRASKGKYVSHKTIKGNRKDDVLHELKRYLATVESQLAEEKTEAEKIMKAGKVEKRKSTALEGPRPNPKVIISFELKMGIGRRL